MLIVQVMILYIKSLVNSESIERVFSLLEERWQLSYGFSGKSVSFPVQVPWDVGYRKAFKSAL